MSLVVSCHHPALGGGDDLALSVGVDAVNASGTAAHNVLGLGRFAEEAGGDPLVPRNAPTVFNIGLWRESLFWDGRVARLNMGGPGGGGPNAPITTPDAASHTTADTTLPMGAGLTAAQARFPVTSVEEMRGEFSSDADNATLRAELAQRLANIDAWESAFETVYGDTTITYDRIADAMAEYEDSMIFVDNPWNAYVNGDNDAITAQQKRGAELFFTDIPQGGAGCSRCHRGDFFTDEQHHVAGYPQIGHGKGNDSGNGTNNDFGRENITGDTSDRFHFRTPTLLNVAATAPYGHTGAYQTLEEVVAHYDSPNNAIDRLFGEINGVAFAGNATICSLSLIHI